MPQSPRLSTSAMTESFTSVRCEAKSPPTRTSSLRRGDPTVPDHARVDWPRLAGRAGAGEGARRDAADRVPNPRLRYVPSYKIRRVIRIRRVDVIEYLERVKVRPGELAHLYPPGENGDPPRKR